MRVQRDPMKATMMDKTATALRRLVLCAAPLMLICSVAAAPARAQDAAAPTQVQSQGQAPADETLSEGKLAQLVAPIALYPDPLLTQILMASTYPLEVVEAARWSQDNSTVQGQALQDAMQAQSWDPSVKALAAVPQTLQMMSDKLDWTQQLGDAFLAQQQDGLNAVQKLRAEAQAAGNLQSTPQQLVTTTPAPADIASTGVQQPIVIEPVNPNVYSVPVYDPAVAYGTWDYPDYPPFYWSPPGFVAGNVVSFAAGVAVGAAIWGGCDWWHNSVIINVNRYNIFNRTNINVTNNVWVHNPAHRGTVPYRNAAVAERFGLGNEAAERDAFRDRIQHDDMFKDRADAGRPDAFRREGEAGDAARRFAPALAERRDGDLRLDGGDRRVDRAILERRNFAPPQAAVRRPAMRSRAQVFRPERRVARGGFHFGGGRRRF
jgi:uncharacterized protein DUF3300